MYSSTDVLSLVKTCRCVVYRVLNDKDIWSRWLLTFQPSLSLVFVSLLISSLLVRKCEKCGRANYFIHPAIRDVLFVRGLFVDSKVVEIIGPMRRLELQAEWRTVWYGTRGKFRCLSHKACMLTLNSESRHQKCFSCDVCSMCCAWVLSVCFGVCVSVCAFLSLYRWRCCKSPAFDCVHAGLLLR